MAFDARSTAADDRLVLAGDVGGTKTALAVISARRGVAAPVFEKTLPSKNYPSLEALLRDFLAEAPYPLQAASFGVAGPVVGGQVGIKGNLPWTIATAALQEELKIKTVVLLNDLEAVGHSVPLLASDDFVPLNDVRRVPGGTVAIVAPGTGLGEAFAAWTDGEFRVFASEGGHADFAPNSELELDLLRYLRPRFSHVSYDRVCSGIGIPNLYAFLREARGLDEPSWLRERLEGAHDSTPGIISAALDAEHPVELCVRTLDLFISILGAEAGNLALKVLATGGVYLGGGIPPRILPALQSAAFANAFRAKGRMSGLLAAIPVLVIRNPGAARLGAATRALKAIESKA